MGLCARFVLGVGYVGSLLRLALFDVFLGGMGWWIAGIWGGGVGFVGVCFGSRMGFLGLHIIYMMNVTSLIFLG